MTRTIATILGSLALVAAPALAQDVGSAGSERQDLSNPDSAFVDTTPAKAWQAEIAPTEGGYLIGNPDADMRLTEFISYTCPHCADFTKQAGPAMDLALVAPGKLAVEVRPVIRNWLDLTVTLLARCGDTAGFKDRHRMFLYSQEEWLGRAASAPKSQQQSWARATADARLSAARALDLDDRLATRGMDLPVINACLMDDAAAQSLLDRSNADRTQYGIQGTPSFAINGETLEGVYSWQALLPELEKRHSAGQRGAP